MSYHRPYDPYLPPGYPHHHHHPPPPPPDYPPPPPPLPPPPPPPPLPPPGYQGYFYDGPPPPPPHRQQQNNQDDSGCISFLKGWYDVSSLRSLYDPLIFSLQVISESVHFISPARNA